MKFKCVHVRNQGFNNILIVKEMQYNLVFFHLLVPGRGHRTKQYLPGVNTNYRKSSTKTLMVSQKIINLLTGMCWAGTYNFRTATHRFVTLPISFESFAIIVPISQEIVIWDKSFQWVSNDVYILGSDETPEMLEINVSKVTVEEGGPHLVPGGNVSHKTVLKLK